MNLIKGQLRMLPRTNTTNAAKAWLSELLLYREMYKGPNGKPLYGYQLTQSEFKALRQLLVTNRGYGNHHILSEHWAACFCLFIAECYRREYDASEVDWAWAGFEDRLQCSFSQQRRADLVEEGLKYWKRPIRQRERGRDLLGSLFAEGGLPWLLVQKESHGFGRAVLQGLKHFSRAADNGRTTTDLMADYEQYLPKAFRTLETRQQLAGIIEQLMHLVEHYPLKGLEDPASYLDEHISDWRSDFPIPLDEDNGRSLINDWLNKAVGWVKNPEEKAQAFTCRHQLLGELPIWRIRTELVLPKNELLKLDTSKLNSTRLELAFYEGEQLLAKGGAVYGQIENNGLSVRFPNTQIPLERREPSKSISLRLLENGLPVHIFHFEDSALEYNDQPLIFEPQAEEWWFAASASTALAATRVRIRLPAGFKLLTGKVSVLAEEEDGRRWLETMENTSFGNGQDVFAITLNQNAGVTLKPYFSGIFAQYESLPNIIFLGWPRLELPDGHPAQKEILTHYVNGQPLTTLQSREYFGLMRYSLRNREGETLLHRRFGILPKDFAVYLYPAFNNRPARLLVRNGQGLHLRVIGRNISSQPAESDQGALIHLYTQTDEPPTTFILEVSSQSGIEAVQLHLPYPYQGARLIGSDGKPLSKRELIIDELLGKRIALSSGGLHGEKFYLQMELVSQAERRLRKRYTLNVGQAPLMLNLFSYQNDMIQMLGAVCEQDAYIRFTIETEQRLLTLNVRRYNGHIRWEGSSMFAVTEINSPTLKSDVKVAAMLLPDPKQTPIDILEKTTEGVGTGWFESLPVMERKGPWLIYPAHDSPVLFRPALYISANSVVETEEEDVHSLHLAAQLFHPQKRPDVIDNQIAAMAIDLGHSGWQYLADLKQNFSHLPLSTFESWLSLSRNPEALATAVFRLEIDEAFCGRIRDELAVVWECIPLPLWANIYARFHIWLMDMGLPEVLQQSILSNRKMVLPAVVSGFEFIDSYLESADSHKLKSIGPEHVLPIWYQELRRRHESNRNWPTDLGVELSVWVHKQSLPNSIKKLSSADFTDAVTYLPIFIAYVTAGKARLEELPVDQVLLKFVIKMLSDFDRNGWYTSVHTLLVSYLLASTVEA